MSARGPGAPPARPQAAHDPARRRVFGALAAGVALALVPRPAPSRAATVAGAGDAARVVSVGGALTEIVYELGAGDALVATDTTSTWPAAAAALPKVGYLRALSAEGLLSLRPTLLLAAADAGPAAVLAQVAGAGVPVVRGEREHGYPALQRAVRALGDALGRESQARALAARLDAEWTAVEARVARATRRPRVLFVLAHAGNTVQVSGRGTAADAVIALGGGRNALDGFEGYRPLTAEGAVQAAPDVIVATRQGVEAVGSVAALLRRPGLGLTPAGRASRVVAPEASFLLGFGPRLPAAVDELARAFAG